MVHLSYPVLNTRIFLAQNHDFLNCPVLKMLLQNARSNRAITFL
ncbi:unnamed protein product [Kuraishia capsulata CBS 1993]|uniref:Uncharacterized protein n=1 Tax=Kuraishia capsulata CBS 1993 TaxID=1382522 RepID=W6MFJ5_9ASCO|nr:uncharacterized protein KUCA_T00000078001 [Kuraishia capsulata CBS 1993]CDK24118.1 unnamed protein product [Kuraishia capsulata CBS 1993]